MTVKPCVRVSTIYTSDDMPDRNCPTGDFARVWLANGGDLFLACGGSELITLQRPVRTELRRLMRQQIWGCRGVQAAQRALVRPLPLRKKSSVERCTKRSFSTSTRHLTNASNVLSSGGSCRR